MVRWIVSAIGAMAALTGSGMAEPLIIGGAEPWQRPEAAPEITDFSKTDEWYGTALKGVTVPYPYSLKFLEDQGAWFTPFIHTGMTGPYDIRDWH